MISDVLEAPALNPIFRFHFRLVEPPMPRSSALCVQIRASIAISARPRLMSRRSRRRIETDKAREAEGRGFYFVIVADGADQGVVQTAPISREIDGRKSFCWGSWIIKPPRPPGLVTFSAICIYELGFYWLGLRSRASLMSDAGEHMGSSTRIPSHGAGAKKTGEDELNLYFPNFRAATFQGCSP